MADESGEVVSFMAEQFKRLHTRFDTVDERMVRLEERVGQVERRLTASTHLEQGLVAHMASLHESMDNFRATVVDLDRRLAKLESH
jgi:chromosome segregation ATPase